MRKTLLLGATALTGLAIAMPAYAQLDEIVVSARKREESLRDLPTSATVLTPDTIQDLVLDGVEDYLRQVPGAILVNGGPAYLTDISLRGQGGGRIGFSESAAGVYRNGIFAAGGGFGGRSFNRMDLFDLARFDVYRGPQGALYGRNAVGGAVNVITQRPKLGETEARAKLAASSFERLDAEGVFNTPLNDNWALRAGGFRYDQNGGQVESLSTGNQLDQREYFGVRGAVHGQVWNDAEVTATIEYYKAEEPAFANIGFNSGKGDPSPFFRANLNREAQVDIKEITTFLEFEKPLGFADFTAIGIYKYRNASRLNEDLDHFSAQLPTASDSTASQSEQYDRYGLEVRFSNPDPSSRLDWLVGADYLQSDEFVSTLQVVNMAVGLLKAGINSLDDFDERIMSYSAFGRVGYDIFENVEIDVQLRVQHDQKEIDLNAPVVAFVPGVRKQTLETDTTQLTPVASIKWQFDPDHMVYTRVGTGYRPGGFNQNAANRGGTTVQYDPETGISYELGWKGSFWDRHVSVDLSTFYMYTNDVQLVTADDSAIAVFVLQNAGDTDIYGAELEVRTRWDIGPGTFSTNTGLSTAYGEFRDGTQAVVSGMLLDLSGARVNRTRDYILNLSTTYSMPLFNTGLRGSATASVQAEGGGYENASGDTSDPGGRDLDHFDMLDLRFALFGDDWRASVYVKNLYDEIYRLQDISGNVYINEGRTFGGDLTLNF
ncbi:MAG: TonB-dependent receptor [Alphaproteobacteria bacterium]|nr:TonB-dependent receptor [Alphaproteobacteria bacterium]